MTDLISQGGGLGERLQERQFRAKSDDRRRFHQCATIPTLWYSTPWPTAKDCAFARSVSKLGTSKYSESSLFVPNNENPSYDALTIRTYIRLLLSMNPSIKNSYILEKLSTTFEQKQTNTFSKTALANYRKRKPACNIIPVTTSTVETWIHLQANFQFHIAKEDFFHKDKKSVQILETFLATDSHILEIIGRYAPIPTTTTTTTLTFLEDINTGDEHVIQQ